MLKSTERLKREFSVKLTLKMDSENYENALLEFTESAQSLIDRYEVDDANFNEFLLSNFEQAEPKFDQLTLIRELKSSLSDEFAVELTGQCKNQESVKEFVKKTKKSTKFVKWKQRVQDDMIQNVTNLFENENNAYSSKNRHRLPSEVNFLDMLNSASSWMSASSPYGQSTLFVGKNVLKRCLVVLESQSDAEDKINVLLEISAMRSSDVAQSEQWPHLQEVLVTMLNENQDEFLQIEILRLVLKLFNSQCHQVVVGVFLVLLKNLEFYAVRNVQSVRFDDGLNVEQAEIKLYLTKFRLFHLMLQTFPAFWIRYSDDTINTVVEKTMNFLSCSDAMATCCLNPLITFALFDLDMKWLQSWMFSTFSSTKIINFLKTNPSLLRFLINVFFDNSEWSQSSEETNSKFSSWTLPSNYQSCQLKSLLYSVASRVLCLFTQYANVKNSLFPIRLNGSDEAEYWNFDEFLRKFVSVWLYRKEIRNIFDVKFITCSMLNMTSTKMRDSFSHCEIQEMLLKHLTQENGLLEMKTSIVLMFNQFYANSNSLLINILFETNLSMAMQMVRYCSKIVNLAWQKDPDAPLNLLYAVVKLLKTFCKTHVGRVGILNYGDTVLQDLVRLAKDKSLPGDFVFPLLAACQRRTSDVRKFLYNSFNFSFSLVNSPLWSTPLEYPCGNLVQKYVEYIRIVANQSVSDNGKFESEYGYDVCCSSSTTCQDHFSCIQEVTTAFASVFVWLCNPSALNDLVTNETFVTLVDNSFGNFHKDSSTFIFNLIRIAVCNLDFVLVLRQRTEQGNKLKFLMEHNFMTDEKQLEITPASMLLLNLYNRQKVLAGPSERSFDGVLESFNSSACFRAEPSRFLVKPSSVSSATSDASDDVLRQFLTAVSVKQRISHADLITQCLSRWSTLFPSNSDASLESGNNDRVAGATMAHCGTESGWTLILEYGENLKLYDDLRKATIELKNVLSASGIYEMPVESPPAVIGGRTVDWFVGAVFLICNGRSSKTVRFLRCFSNNFTKIGSLWPLHANNSATYRESVLNYVTPLVEKVGQHEYPSVLACLNRSAVALSNILLIWLNQCFLNFLDYPEVANFVTLSVLGGQTYLTIFCCCICKHLSVANSSGSDIRSSFHANNLHNFLSDGYAFRLHNYISFVQHLLDVYHDLF